MILLVESGVSSGGCEPVLVELLCTGLCTSLLSTEKDGEVERVREREGEGDDSGPETEAPSAFKPFLAAGPRSSPEPLDCRLGLGPAHCARSLLFAPRPPLDLFHLQAPPTFRSLLYDSLATSRLN